MGHMIWSIGIEFHESRAKYRFQALTWSNFYCETWLTVAFSLMKNSEKQKRRNFHVLQLITSTEMSSSTIHMPRLVALSGKRGNHRVILDGLACPESSAFTQIRF